MLKFAVWLCLFKYSLCADPAPCNCECSNYGDVDVKQIQFNEQQQCQETCCSAEVKIDSKIDYMEHMKTINGCGMRNPTGIGLKVLGDKKNEAEYGLYIKYLFKNFVRLRLYF